MKRALPLERGEEGVVDAKRARTEHADDQESASAHVFGIDEMRALILVEHMGDLSTDIPTLARCRLVSKAFYKTLDWPRYPMLAAIPNPDFGVLAWTNTSRGIAQVAKRAILDPRFLDKPWLRLNIPGNPYTRGECVFYGWVGGGDLVHFDAVIEAQLQCSGIWHFRPFSKYMLLDDRAEMLRRYLNLCATKGCRPSVYEQQYLVNKAIKGLRFECLDMLLALYPFPLPASAVQRLDEFSTKGKARSYAMLKNWLLDHCRGKTFKSMALPRGSPLRIWLSRERAADRAMPRLSLDGLVDAEDVVEEEGEEEEESYPSHGSYSSVDEEEEEEE